MCRQARCARPSVLKAWLSRRAERRAVRAAAARFQSGTSEADVRALRAALVILGQASLDIELAQVNRFAVSRARRYCALTLVGGQTYAVDLHSPAYLHWANAGLEGFDGERLCLDPDERRLALEAWWVDPYLEDLSAPLMPWRRLDETDNGADSR